MSIEDTKNLVRNFIVEELNHEGDPSELTDDLPLIDNKVIDSLGIFQLVTFLEEKFDIEIGDDELLPDKFGTIAAIAALVEGKKA